MTTTRTCQLCREQEATELHYTRDGRIRLCDDCYQHIMTNGLDGLTRKELLDRRREFLFSPEFQLVEEDGYDEDFQGGIL